jgi:hypothetical protein
LSARLKIGIDSATTETTQVDHHVLVAASDSEVIVTQTLLVGSYEKQFVGRHAVCSCNNGWARLIEVPRTPVAIAAPEYQEDLARGLVRLLGAVREIETPRPNWRC